MGIEDLDLDLTQHVDRILLITPDDTKAASIKSILAKNSYACDYVYDLISATELLEESTFDLIIIEHLANEHTTLELLSKLRSDLSVKRQPILFITPNTDNMSIICNGSDICDNIFPLKSPYSAADLLVKVSTQIRMRKRKVEGVRRTAGIEEQNAALRDLTTRYKRELKEAQAVQQALLPASLPEDPRCIFAATYVPLEAVGGDVYDIWKIDDGEYGFLIGDVAGHGLPAAFVGAMTKMALSYAIKLSPHEMLCEMNNGLAKHMPEGRFATAAAAMYTSCNGHLKVARAGHPQPIIWRAKTNTIEIIEVDGMPLGVIEDSDYALYETILRVGDKFLMLTDGITETYDMNGEMLGIEGAGNYFKHIASKYDITQCVEKVLGYQEEYSGGRIVKDDNTVVGLERLQ